MKRVHYFIDKNDYEKYVNHFKKDLEYSLKMKRMLEPNDKKEMYGRMVKYNYMMLNQLRNNKSFIVYR